MNSNMKKIQELQSALNNIGIFTELELNAEWYCIDNQVHYGIELVTDMDYGEDCWSFLFTPDGKYITKATQAPIQKEQANDQTGLH